MHDKKFWNTILIWNNVFLSLIKWTCKVDESLQENLVSHNKHFSGKIISIDECKLMYKIIKTDI